MAKVKVYDFVAETQDSCDPKDTNRVDAIDGWINIIQTNDYGEDCITTITPADARWFAKQLNLAAAVAGKHPRWEETQKKDMSKCSWGHVVSITDGRCVNCGIKVSL